MELEYRRIVERHYVEAENGERTEGEIFGGGEGIPWRGVRRHLDQREMKDGGCTK